ncbi:hypothetical protein CGRA01v4_09121 [Colletotrichum graminicola]|nr:hypothetical protein CGRA01v4_09121 [Colletotrichum graminicola]
MPWQICTLPRCDLSRKRIALVGRRRRRLDCTSPWMFVCHPCLCKIRFFSPSLSHRTPHCLGFPPATIVRINACRLCRALNFFFFFFFLLLRQPNLSEAPGFIFSSSSSSSG